jgi:hypothetical protein
METTAIKAKKPVVTGLAGILVDGSKIKNIPQKKIVKIAIGTPKMGILLNIIIKLIISSNSNKINISFINFIPVLFDS